MPEKIGMGPGTGNSAGYRHNDIKMGYLPYLMPFGRRSMLRDRGKAPNVSGRWRKRGVGKSSTATGNGVAEKKVLFVVLGTGVFHTSTQTAWTSV